MCRMISTVNVYVENGVLLKTPWTRSLAKEAWRKLPMFCKAFGKVSNHLTPGCESTSLL